MPDWTQSPRGLAERWEAVCRQRGPHPRVAFFLSLGRGGRRCRLFALACVRAAFAKRPDPRSRALLDLVERPGSSTPSCRKAPRGPPCN